MKVSDIMLDMATGDASVHDVFIQEAVGKVNVASAIFDTAYKISELGPGEFMCVQEAADAGLPTDQDGACTLACESVQQEILAFYDVVSETAKKVKQAADKDLKLLIAIGKKLGVTPNQGDFVTTFAEPLADAILNTAAPDAKKKVVEMANSTFLKSKYSIKIAKNYGQGMAEFTQLFGLSIAEIFEDESIRAALGTRRLFKKTPSAGYKSDVVESVESLSDIVDLIGTGSVYVGFDKLVSKDSHFTSTVKRDDIVDLATGLFAIFTTAKAIEAVATKSAKKAAVEPLKAVCNCEGVTDDKKTKKINKNLAYISDEIKQATEKTTNIVDALVTAFTDSVNSLTETLNGGIATE